MNTLAQPQIQNFNHPQFGVIRMLSQDGEPWFVAKDVCDSLELGNPRQAITSLDEDEKSTVTTNDGGPARNIINESGLYSLILRSRKPEAKKFKKWVTSEVLPSIRKTGSYSQPQLSDDEIVHQALLITQKKVESLKLELEEAKPKAEFYDTVMASPTVCEMSVACAVAKLPFGRNTLYRKLREDGVLMSEGKRHNLPKRRFVDQDLFVVNESTFRNPRTDEPIVTFTTYVTQKGIDWLRKQYQAEGGKR